MCLNINFTLKHLLCLESISSQLYFFLKILKTFLILNLIEIILICRKQKFNKGRYKYQLKKVRYNL